MRLTWSFPWSDLLFEMILRTDVADTSHAIATKDLPTDSVMLTLPTSGSSMKKKEL